MKPITQTSTTFGAKILFNLLHELGYPSIKDYQTKNGLTADGIFGLVSFTKLYNQLLHIIEVPFEGAYHKISFDKKQIIWHHSAGRDNARGMFDSWKRDDKEHVATAIGINDDGQIYRGYDEEFWASSIGCKQDVFTKMGIKALQQTINGRVFTNNSFLDATAVGVEVCNSGTLTLKDGKYLSWFNMELPKEKVIELNYKGYKYFERYTDQEIASLKNWTLLMGIRFDIPLFYSEADMWSVSKKALSGEKGLFTHNSYRSDKTDVSPQPHLIEMAKSLDKYMA
jgi:hypothetical protein